MAELSAHVLLNTIVYISIHICRAEPFATDLRSTLYFLAFKQGLAPHEETT